MENKRQQAKSQTNTKISNTKQLRYPPHQLIDNLRSQTIENEESLAKSGNYLSNPATDQQVSTIQNTNDYQKEVTIQNKSLDRTHFNSNMQSHVSYQNNNPRLTTHLTKYGNEIQYNKLGTSYRNLSRGSRGVSFQ